MIEVSKEELHLILAAEQGRALFNRELEHGSDLGMAVWHLTTQIDHLIALRSTFTGRHQTRRPA